MRLPRPERSMPARTDPFPTLRTIDTVQSRAPCLRGSSLPAPLSGDDTPQLADEIARARGQLAHDGPRRLDLVDEADALAGVHGHRFDLPARIDVGGEGREAGQRDRLAGEPELADDGLVGTFLAPASLLGEPLPDGGRP